MAFSRMEDEEAHRATKGPTDQPTGLSSPSKIRDIIASSPSKIRDIIPRRLHARIPRNHTECKPIPLFWEKPRVVVLCDLLPGNLVVPQTSLELGVRDGGPLHTALPKHPLLPHLQMTEVGHDPKIWRRPLQWWQRGWRGGGKMRGGRPDTLRLSWRSEEGR